MLFNLSTHIFIYWSVSTDWPAPVT